MLLQSGKLSLLLKKIHPEHILLLMLLAISAVFMLHNLGKFAAVDEPLWTYDRIPQYWKGIFTKDVEKTMISDKPGVTVALVSGPVLSQLNPKEYRTKKEAGEIIKPGKNLERFNYLFRLPIALFALFAIFPFYFLISKLFNPSTALFSGIFIFLSPILIGISRIINPDSLFWIFVPLSIISYLLCIKENNRKYAILAGIFFGLALLTKYVANILFLYYLAVPLLAGLFGLVRNLKKSLVDYLIVSGAAIVVFILFLPATWLQPALILDATILSQAFGNYGFAFLVVLGLIFAETIIFNNKFFQKICFFFRNYRQQIFFSVYGIFIFFSLFAVANVFGEMRWIDFEGAVTSPKTFHQVSGIFSLFAAGFYSLVFGVSPLLLAVFLPAIFFLFKKNKLDTKFIFILSSLFLFIFLYYFASAISAVSANIRYQIVIFPIFFILLAAIFDYWRQEYARKIKWLYIAAIIFTVFLSAELLAIKPFYFSYASPLLPAKYVLNLKDMGDGSFEAAQKLNTLPNARALTIWSDKSGVCFFFIGTCYSDMDFNNPLLFDYFVVSAGRENKVRRLIEGRMASGVSYAINPADLYTEKNPFWKLEIGRRPNNFVKIISAAEINKTQ